MVWRIGDRPHATHTHIHATHTHKHTTSQTQTGRQAGRQAHAHTRTTSPPCVWCVACGCECLWMCWRVDTSFCGQLRLCFLSPNVCLCGKHGCITIHVFLLPTCPNMPKHAHTWPIRHVVYAGPGLRTRSLTSGSLRPCLVRHCMCSRRRCAAPDLHWQAARGRLLLHHV